MVATYETKINSLIKEKSYKIPFTNSKFASTEAIGRLSNSKTRFTSDWNHANRTSKDSVNLRLLSWLGRLLGWHIDHIKPVSKGGSFNVKNLRLLPPSLNHMMGDSGNWPHEKLNRFVEHLGPEWRKELGIPDSFKSCSPDEFFKSIRLVEPTPLTLEELTDGQLEQLVAQRDMEAARRAIARAAAEAQ